MLPEKIPALVDQALRAAGIPIVGVTINDPANRGTWRVTFDPSATPAQITQGNALLATVAIDATGLHAQDQKDAQGEIDAIPIVTKAIVLALVDQLNVIRAALPTPLAPITPAQAIAAIRAKAGTL
jgi:hypothetical protein